MWILIVAILFNGIVTTSINQEFETEGKCLNGLEQISQSITTDSTSVVGLCIIK